MYSRTRLILCTALLHAFPAHPREVSILHFGGSERTPRVIYEQFQNHLEPINLPNTTSSEHLINLVPIPPYSARSAMTSELVGRISKPADPIGHHCKKTIYTPAWWLKPDAEARRAAHYGLMASIACEFGLPPTLLDAVIAQESSYKPWAISDAGAIGMMQIMPGTARMLGLTRPFDPTANMRAGARYFRQQIDRFGRIDLALAAYNAGPERRSLAVGNIPAIPETIHYVRTITRNWARLAATPPSSVLPSRRAQAATVAVLAAGYRTVELTRYDGMNSANPI